MHLVSASNISTKLKWYLVKQEKPIFNILITVITTTIRVVFKLSNYSYNQLLDYNIDIVYIYDYNYN